MSINLEGDGAWPDLKEKGFVEGRTLDVVVLAGGTQSGRPSVTLRVDLPDGSTVIAETTARLFCTAARAIMARYPDLFEGD